MGEYFAGYTVDMMINGELVARRDVIRWAGGTPKRYMTAKEAEQAAVDFCKNGAEPRFHPGAMTYAPVYPNVEKTTEKENGPKTCKRGHLLVGANIYEYKSRPKANGGYVRACNLCRSENNKKKEKNVRVCKQGHVIDGENAATIKTIVLKSGEYLKVCRTCRNEQKKASRDKKKAKQ